MEIACLLLGLVARFDESIRFTTGRALYMSVAGECVVAYSRKLRITLIEEVCLKSISSLNAKTFSF